MFAAGDANRSSTAHAEMVLRREELEAHAEAERHHVLHLLDHTRHRHELVDAALARCNTAG